MPALDFSQLVEDFYMPLYRFAFSLSRNESDAADLTQETFLLWARKGHQLRDSSKVKTWLFTSLYREFLGGKRKQDRLVTSENNPDFEATQIVPAEFVRQLDGEVVQRALLALDETHRAPLVLFYLQQNSYRDIAAILKIPIGTVMSRISRGKAQLRAALKENNSLTKNQTEQPAHG